MIAVDFHVHTLFSKCGLHTVLELLNQARTIGIKGFAVTDHGPAVDGHHNSVFFERFISPDPLVRILKGMECNPVDAEGTIDAPVRYLPYTDIILCGIHLNIEKGMGESIYTGMLQRAIETNPVIDVISHPNDPNFPVDFHRLAETASAHGVALELNNSKIHYRRSSTSLALELLEACRDQACRIALSSDTHAIHELGDDGAIRPLLKQIAFPEELIVNSIAEKAFAFIEERKPRKRPENG